MIYRDRITLLLAVPTVDPDTGETIRQWAESVVFPASVQPASDSDLRAPGGVYRADSLVAFVPRAQVVCPGDVLLYESQRYRAVSVRRFLRHVEVTMERSPEASA